jgi:hypothetical protein
MAASLAFASGARGAASFTTVKLGPMADGTSLLGGEPSIAVDRNYVYISSPQGTPSVTPGIGFWVSNNDGSSFGPARLIGSNIGGGDDDVTVSEGNVYVADLEAPVSGIAAGQTCRSTDHGATFTGIGPFPDPGKCTTLNLGQTGPSQDRAWLTPDATGHLYLTYHEFNTNQPLIFRDDHGGNDLFLDTVCGSIVSDPSIEANVPTIGVIGAGALVGRPVTDPQGNLYVPFTTSTQPQSAAALAAGQTAGTFSQIYLAVSTNGCRTFTDYTIFDGSKLGTNSVQFGDLFNDLAIDGAGNLYSVSAGFIGDKAFAPTANIYLQSSTDHGKTWSAPILVDQPSAAHMLPAAVGGPLAGQLSIGYFRTVNGVTDPANTSGKWTYSTAQSSNAQSATPTFASTDVNPGFVYHTGDICNEGDLCGLLPNGPSDRSLLDFTSAAIDAQGCPLYTFAGNPTTNGTDILGNPVAQTDNYVTRQTSGCFAHATGYGGSQAGGVQTAHAKGKGAKSRCTTAKRKSSSKRKKRSHKRSRSNSRARAHTAAAKCKAASKHKKSKHHAAKRNR